jgi:hypothetical protein
MKYFLVAIFISFYCLSTLASSRVDECIVDERNTRIDEVNRIILKINEAQVELNNFQFELKKIEANSSKLDHEIFMRNTAGVISALGFVTTLAYQKKYISPRAYMLAGGYTLSAVSAIVMAIENNGVRLSHKEINDLKASIKKIENLIILEKKNLEREIGFLVTSLR